jgi:hypothetical protein
VGGTAWCRRQCAVPSWGRRVAHARERASAGEGGRKGASASFIDEVRQFARRKKNITAGTVRDDPDLWRGGCRHICMTDYFKVNGVGTLWLTGNDEVMTWCGDPSGFYGKGRDDFCHRCRHAYAGY